MNCRISYADGRQPTNQEARLCPPTALQGDRQRTDGYRLMLLTSLANQILHSSLLCVGSCLCLGKLVHKLKTTCTRPMLVERTRDIFRRQASPQPICRGTMGVMSRHESRNDPTEARLAGYWRRRGSNCERTTPNGACVPATSVCDCPMFVRTTATRTNAPQLSHHHLLELLKLPNDPYPPSQKWSDGS